MGKQVEYEESVRVGRGGPVHRPSGAVGGQAAYVTTSRPVRCRRYPDGQPDVRYVHANSTGTRNRSDGLRTEVFVERRDGRYERVVDVLVEQHENATVVTLNGAVIATVWK